MTTLRDIMSIALYPALAILAGGALSLWRAPGPRLSSGIQHFTAGVLFAALATELLPDVVHRRQPWITLAGFSLGVAAMLVLKRLTEKFAQKDGAGNEQPASLIATLGLDLALDGALIGLGFAAGQRQGLLLTIALTLEVVFVGLSGGAALRGAGSGRGKVVLVITGFALLLLAGAAAGALLLHNAPAALLDAVLAFGVAALLYLVTEELLTEAHEVPETPVQTAMFFVGFIVLLLIEMML